MNLPPVFKDEKVYIIREKKYGIIHQVDENNKFYWINKDGFSLGIYGREDFMLVLEEEYETSLLLEA
jgi:hypothetical protein